MDRVDMMYFLRDGLRSCGWEAEFLDEVSGVVAARKGERILRIEVMGEEGTPARYRFFLDGEAAEYRSAEDGFEAVVGSPLFRDIEVERFRELLKGLVIREKSWWITGEDEEPEGEITIVAELGEERFRVKLDVWWRCGFDADLFDKSVKLWCCLFTSGATPYVDKTAKGVCGLLRITGGRGLDGEPREIFPLELDRIILERLNSTPLGAALAEVVGEIEESVCSSFCEKGKEAD
jgi:hypothetical protein